MPSIINSRPFLVSSGGQRRRTSASTVRHEAAIPPGRRTSVTASPRSGPGEAGSGPPPGRLTLTERSIPNPAALQSRNRFRSDISPLASKVGAIPEAEEKRGNANVDAAGGVTTSSPSGRRTTVFRQPVVGSVATRRRPSTVKSLSRRGSTMKELLEQQKKQEQPPPRVEPVDENNSLQAERQERRKRGLNLGYAGWRGVDRREV